MSPPEQQEEGAMALSDFIDEFQQDRIFIITGPPGGGKTTYARNLRQPGDIVIDLDYIAAALMLSTSAHEDKGDVLDAAWFVRDQLIKAVASGSIAYGRAFIIATTGAEKLREETGGTVVVVDPGMDETLRRIQADETMTDSEKKRRKDSAVGYYYRKARGKK